MNNEIIKVKIDSIIPNTYQPRKIFNEDLLKELSQSIVEHGIIQPLTIRQIGPNYELVAGERRLRAAKLAKLEEVPCILLDISDIESAQIALLENLQREDLSFIEEAEAYQCLISDHYFTQAEIAIKMAKSQSTIANKLRLLKLSDKVRVICTQNNLTERHARALLKLPNEKVQIKVINKVIKDELNVKNTEELINNELLKLSINQETKKTKNKIKTVFPSKLYINSIKQIFDKLSVPANYGVKENEDYIEIIVKIDK